MELARDTYLDGVVNGLRRIIQAIRLSSSAAQDTLGITGAQLFVLQQLAEQPVSSLRELAARTRTDQSSVSVVVARLVKSGHVARRLAAGDHRRAELTLTASGRGLLRRAPELAQSRLVSSLRRMPPRQLKTTAAVLDRVARDLGAGSGSPAMFFEPGPRVPRRAVGRARGRGR